MEWTITKKSKYEVGDTLIFYIEEDIHFDNNFRSYHLKGSIGIGTVSKMYYSEDKQSFIYYIEGLPLSSKRPIYQDFINKVMNNLISFTFAIKEESILGLAIIESVDIVHLKIKEKEE